MKKKFPLPMIIDCEGLSQKLIAELADRLSFHFHEVTIDGEEITAHKPLSFSHYGIAWKIIDRFGVKVV